MSPRVARLRKGDSVVSTLQSRKRRLYRFPEQLNGLFVENQSKGYMLMAWDGVTRNGQGWLQGAITSTITQGTVSRTWILSHAPLLSLDRQASSEKSFPGPGRLGLLLVTPRLLPS